VQLWETKQTTKIIHNRQPAKLICQYYC